MLKPTSDPASTDEAHLLDLDFQRRPVYYAKLLLLMGSKGQCFNPPPLNGQPERQATDSLLGYDYQIWRTVEIWMQLRPGEVLYLECAEDFDVVTADSATTNQVKNSPNNITLSSGEVRDAIVNHWTCVQKNPGRSVKMRFLTRGDVGSEKGKPFGEARGIEVWRQAAEGNTQADQVLTCYLLGKVKDISLKGFLSTSTAQERRTKLYGAIEWVAREPVIDAVRISVRRAAIERGNFRGLATHISLNAVPALLEKCRQVVEFKQPEMRSLTTEDLQEVFDGSTSIQVPATQSIVAMLGQALAFASAGGLPVAFSSFAESGELPPLPAFVMPRVDFCGRVLTALASGPVLIVGSEGKGKSIVANLVARSGSAGSHWTELPDQVERVCFALERLLMLVRSQQGPRCIVLDDVPAALGLDSQVWSRLNALFESCRAFGAQLLMTAKGVPEDQVDTRFRTSSVQVLPVPVLTQPEVEAFFDSLGCSPDAVRSWATSALVQSGNGHPKLVHLRGLELRDQGWPKPTIDDFLKSPASIEEARTNARHKVSKTVPEPDKSYLYTLSVAVLPFSREQALTVGTMVGLSSPGEAFDRLSGRWIEAKGKDLYSVTNLLSNQALQVFSAEQVNKAHCLLFDAFVGGKSIHVTEVWGVFFQAFLSQDHWRLGNFIGSLINTDFKEVPGLAESLEILLPMASGDVLVGPYDANLSAMFRQLQFKIASHSKPEMMEKIALEWAWTIQQIENEQVRRGAAVMRGLSLATRMEGNLPSAMLVDAIADAADIDLLGLDIPTTPTVEEITKSDGSPLDHVGLLFLLFQAQCDGFQFVENTLGALEKLHPDLRNRMLKAFEARFIDSTSLIARAWLVERKREQPNWQGLLQALEHANVFAKRWGSRCLGHNVAKIRSIIFEEEDDVKDQQRSVAMLDAAEHDFGESPVIVEQRANIEFMRGNHGTALELWESCLDIGLDSTVKPRDPYACRKAAISAFKVGRYDRAAKLLESGGQMVSSAGIGPVRAAFDVDAAYCWFKFGNLERALEVLAGRALQLQGVYDSSTEFQMFRAQKHCGSLALWMLGQVIPGEKAEYDEPQVGIASAPDQQELLATLPPSPFPVSAVMILRVASRLGIDGPHLSQLRIATQACRMPLVGFQITGLQVKEAISNGDFTDFGHRMLHFQCALWQGIAARKSSADGLVDAQFNVSDDIKSSPIGSVWYFALALTILKMQGGDPLSWTAKWIEQVSSSPDSAPLLADIQAASEGFSMTFSEALAQLRATPSIKNIAAAAIVLAQPERRPLDTCYAQVGLLTWLPDNVLVMGTLEAAFPQLANLFSEQWQPHLSQPALLSNPRLSIPALSEAIGFQGSAPARLKKLLFAGSLATGLRIPQDTSDSLDRVECRNSEAERLSNLVAAKRKLSETLP